ncbi:MAG: glutamate synthase subunit beta [Thermoleophilia bacterium]|nr:glutamate synthase subunit beta [Thermoleophilia bacterium]
MSRERAFLEIDRTDVSYRPSAERVRDYRAVDLPLTEDEILAQAARCMDCGTPFCHASATGCPLSNTIPEFNEHAYYGRWKEALDILLFTNCFPEFTGRICPAPCEGACVLGLIRPPVNICKIELAIVEHGFQRGYLKAQPPMARHRERVAVVGSGPAGLATAHVLNRAGFNVTVYEKDPRPGGLLRYGIPDFKLEKWVVDQRIDLMTQEGVEFECSVDVGDDVSHRFLRDRFDAIVLAGGAGVPRDLDVPGRELDGVHFALDFLTQQNRVNGGDPVSVERHISAAGKSVVVIGGGDTGADCIGTSWRQGARQVVQLEILPEPPATRSESTPWPQWPLMRRDSTSHKEGGTRYWSVDTTAFSGEQDRVRQVHCTQVEWTPDETRGLLHPQAVPGSEFTLEADLVLIAMGFVGPSRTQLVERLCIAKDDRGFIGCSEGRMTNVEGVFVAGDMRRGASLVVHAIADGMQTARHVMHYLKTKGTAHHV